MRLTTKRAFLLVTATAGLLAPSLWGVTPALAASCTGGYAAPFYEWVRSANDVYGVRAPVEMRLDGGLCGAAADYPFAASWIGIQGQSGGVITQVGVEKDFNPTTGAAQYCRFWAIGTGIAHDYDCGTDNDGVYIFFRISRYYDPTTHLYYYEIDDCGTSGGYGNCTNKNDAQEAYSDPEGEVAAETDFGCVVHLLGTSARPVNYGTSSNPVQGLDSSSWATRNWAGYDEGNCASNYMRSSNSDSMSTWDTRNSS